MIFLFNLFFLWNLKNFFLKKFFKILVFYIYDTYLFVNKIWFNFNYKNNFIFFKNIIKLNFIFFFFNLFNNYFFFSLIKFIFNSFLFKRIFFYCGYLNIYQINHFYNFSFYFIINNIFDLKRKYIYN
ncbi:hypothetical protein NASMSEV_107 [Candidatus Nasuia deltocephalinicola]|uniref:Uncharacterized protein n=1 Tax=Candidatus Nasuia deltocephalincola TaxID=1160784 RepID=A0A7G6UHR7_9PROT|nr:hypothetical protein NASMSEV_107 [Candidatus Nasuia deltocephalinicola]